VSSSFTNEAERALILAASGAISRVSSDLFENEIRFRRTVTPGNVFEVYRHVLS
jgi:hypothetical protein